MQVTGFKVEHVAGDVEYGILESGQGVDELSIDVGIGSTEGFDYFYNKFGMPYDFLLKKSIEFGHVLAVAVRVPDMLLAFARFEKLEDSVVRDHKGEKKVIKYPLYLLRSIEVHSSYRHRGIGRILFAVAARSLCSNVITLPDNSDAARFFRDKLSFEGIDTVSGIDSLKYHNYLMLSSPKAMNMLNILTQRYPRMVLPDLIDWYERLLFKSNRNKKISSEEIEEFETLLMRFGNMMDDKLLGEMNALITDLRKVQ